ncbi:MAG: hypothetical protein HFG85_16560 [Dorea sp.]|nr:hypothetical protein [Dorea sp.]
MRLINAEKLLEEIKRSCMTSKDVEALIKAQPTAYDIDKVINELEEFAHSDICHRNHCRYINADDIDCENCGALCALEIVKRGVTA